MAKPKVEDILTVIAKKADEEMRKLADAVEHREKHTFSHLFANTYSYVLLLKNLNEDFDLPGEWPSIVNDLWNEMEYLRALSNEIARRG